MWIIGCDFHPGFQMVAMMNQETGAVEQRRLGHMEQAEQFYRALAPALVGILVFIPEELAHDRYLYLASVFYHGARSPRAKRLLQIFDHAAIFLLIAGPGPWALDAALRSRSERTRDGLVEATARRPLPTVRPSAEAGQDARRVVGR